MIMCVSSNQYMNLSNRDGMLEKYLILFKSFYIGMIGKQYGLTGKSLGNPLGKKITRTAHVCDFSQGSEWYGNNQTSRTPCHEQQLLWLLLP